ncbi:DUF11 domain-containing protein [Herpetosiphon giganteus]|uniref:DUF11 domain-containing protein n=1 Tax=Herpetosiphon giganteus TaxID=2029754 RepID=UPI001EF770C2|nr:DUF11 domain-containing protein [Herpetosiphon giganteus]MBM7845620.1 putative repeat protein (TIGR01451 family) [Herpetosiphon giganteus]
MLKRIETIAFGMFVMVALVMGMAKLFPAQSSAAQQALSLTPSPEPTELPTDVPTATFAPTTTPRPTDEPQPTSTPSDGATVTPRPTRQPFEFTATPIELTPTATTTMLPTATPSDGATATPIALPDVVLEKTADQQTVAVGDSLRWTLTVANHGNAPAANVLVRDVLPGFFRGLHVTTSLGEATLTDGIVSVTIAELSAGQTITIWIDGTVASLDGPLTNLAQASTTTTETSTENNTAWSSVTPKVAGIAQPSATPRPAAQPQRTFPVTASDDGMPVGLPIGLVVLATLVVAWMLWPRRLG